MADAVSFFDVRLCSLVQNFTLVHCEHSYSSAVTKAATCESDGVMTYTCSLCTDSYTEVIKALGHYKIKHEANHRF